MSIALRIPVALTGPEVIVTDPCYYNGSEHMHSTVGPIRQGGSWVMESHREEMGGWGTRTVELSVVHSTWHPTHKRFLAADAGVDSGQMSICDSHVARSFENPDDYGPDGFQPKDHEGHFDYQGACDITLNHAERGGVLCDVMAVSETGCGDGVYPVYVWRDEVGAATKITVDFRDVENEEEEEEEEEDNDD